MVRRPQGQIKNISDFETEADAETWVRKEEPSCMAKAEGVINRAKPPKTPSLGISRQRRRL
jgi:hypothetical protein